VFLTRGLTEGAIAPEASEELWAITKFTFDPDLGPPPR